MAHSLWSRHQGARLALLVCVLMALAGGLFFALHGPAVQVFFAAASHVVAYVVPPLGWH